MHTVPKLDDVLQRALWSEMKDPAEFRAYLERAGFVIVSQHTIHSREKDRVSDQD